MDVDWNFVIGCTLATVAFGVLAVSVTGCQVNRDREHTKQVVAACSGGNLSFDSTRAVACYQALAQASTKVGN